MASTLDVKPTEKGTLVVTVNWYDEDDNAVTPVTGTWTLTDAAGNVVNSRTAQAFHEALATQNNIVLTGDDLAVTTTAPDDRRVVTVQATYNSTMGTGLALKAAAEFSLEDLVAVT